MLTYVCVCVYVYVVCTQASLSFTSATGNSIGLAKIVVYMPICLFDLCKMCVRRWVNPLPPLHSHTHQCTHTRPTHTQARMMCALRFGQTIQRTSELAATPKASVRPPVRSSVPFVQPGVGQACVLNDISCQRTLADGNGAVPGVRGRG